MNTKTWLAPAKINLFLHIVGKRPDGYHNLQTIFQFLDYGDELSFELNDTGKIDRSYDLGFNEKDDLCLRAAHALRAQAKNYKQSMLGVTISLNKKLPMGGGLGGGSSDAATVLLVLNKLWDLDFSKEQLAELGLGLGADIPVFVMGQSAWAEGVGEQLTPLKVPETWFLVLIPKVSVSTAAIFSNKHLTPRQETKKIRAYQEGFGDNQLEQIVRDEYPEVDALLSWLSSQPSVGKPRMSGSGGSVFLPLTNEQQGLELLEKRPVGSTGFVAKGLNFHPLFNL